MLKVLIVDDTQEKITEIRKVLTDFVDNPDDVPISTCLREALKKCAATRYDLVILDLYIPNKSGEVPDPENAKIFLNAIKSDDDIIAPLFVIGITRMDEIGEYKELFEAETLKVLSYAENDDSWKGQLRNRLEYLTGIKRNIGQTYEYDYDVAIVNALQYPEHEIMMKTLSDAWQPVTLSDDKTTTYYETVLKSKTGQPVRCISCYAHQMASVAAASLTTKLILRFHPRYLFMTGICGALKGNGIGFGDILIASQIWDGMSGKFKEFKENDDPDTDSELIFEPDYRQLPLDPQLLNTLSRLKSDTELCKKIKNGFEGKKPRTPLKIHIGPMTSVPAVIASEQKIADLKRHARKIIGLEMESYGVFYAAEHAHALKPVYTASIKSASDLADKDKTDKYQPYASYTSAALCKYLIEHELDFPT